MTTYNRRQKLLELLRKEPGLSVQEFAARFGVSQGTIRNDLNALSQSNLIIRVRGGAILADSYLTQSNAVRSNAFAARMKINQAAKYSIARQAAQLVHDGDSLLMDASSTVFYMAQFLLERKNLRIVTNCLETASYLSQNPTHNVMLTGGILRAGTESVIGPWSELFLSNLCTHYAFVSCSGFTPEGGMTEVDIFESQFRLKAIQCAQEIIALVDSSKFGKVDLTPSLQPHQIHRLFTDEGLDESWRKRLIESGYTFQVCPLEKEE